MQNRSDWSSRFFLKGKMDYIQTYMNTRMGRSWSGVKGTQKMRVQEAETGTGPGNGQKRDYFVRNLI